MTMTLKVAIPDTSLTDSTNLRKKTAKAGRIARAMAVFRVEEVFVYKTGLVPPSKMRDADLLVEEMMEQILSDLPFKRGDEICLLINNLGSTTMMEMLIANRKINQILNEKGIKIYDTLIGTYCTCQEMAGLSITLMRIDDELKKYYDMPADSLSFKKW